MRINFLVVLFCLLVPSILAQVNEHGYDDSKWLDSLARDPLVSGAIKFVQDYATQHEDFAGYPTPTLCGTKYQLNRAGLFYQVCLTSKSGAGMFFKMRKSLYVVKRHLIKWAYIDQQDMIAMA